MQKPKVKSLTQAIVDAIDRATTKRDGTLPGFVVRAYPPNKAGEVAKSYGLITTSATGKESFTPLSEKFKDATKIPLAKAYREAARLLAAAEGAGGIKVEREIARRRREVEQASQRTFGMVLELWWETGTETKPNNYRVQIDKRILPALGHRLINDIRRSDIIVKVQDPHKKKPSSANMAVMICKIVFEWAADRNLWQGEMLPIYPPIKPLKERKHKVHLNESQIKDIYERLKTATFLAGPDKGKPNPARIPLMLAAGAGCRIGEAENIKLSEIVQDEQGRWFWDIPGEKRKQGDEHINWLPGERLMIARAAAAWSDTLTPKERRQRTRPLLDRILAELGLPKCGANVFRRRVINEQLDHEPLETVAQQIGHANPSTTKKFYVDKGDNKTYDATLRQYERRGF